MAGIGPFAIPAGKKRVFVWANDLNPDSYAAMVEAIKRNKVSFHLLYKFFACSAMMSISWPSTVVPVPNYWF
jgi:tRNA G37 N-methylase Trm5